MLEAETIPQRFYFINTCASNDDNNQRRAIRSHAARSGTLPYRDEAKRRRRRGTTSSFPLELVPLTQACESMNRHGAGTPSPLQSGLWAVPLPWSPIRSCAFLPAIIDNCKQLVHRSCLQSLSPDLSLVKG